MTWYAAYDRNHKLVGTLNIHDDEELRRHKTIQLTGTKKLRIEDIDWSATVDPTGHTIQMDRVTVKLEEVWSERHVLFSYVTLRNEQNFVAHPVMDPNLHWFGASFMPLGAPLMCEWCPDRKRDG